MTDLDANPAAALSGTLGPVIRSLLMGVVVGVPLLVLGAFTLDPYSLPKLALLVGGTGAAAGLVAARWLLGRAPRHARLLAVPALALTVPLVVSWLASPHRGWTLWGSYSRYTGLLPYLAVIGLGLLLVDAFWGRADRLAWALAVAGGAAGTYAFVQVLGLDPVWSPGSVTGSEYPPSTIGHFNFFGGFLALSLPLSLYLWVQATGRAPRVAAMWATIASVLGLLLANSQGGWAAAVAGIAVVAGSFLGVRRPAARAAGMVAAGIVVVVVVGSVLASLLASDAGVLGGTVRARGLLWVTALEMGADSPVVGRGPGAYSLEGVRYRPLASVLAEKNSKADEPHSVPLTFWSSAGALGALGFAAFVAWILAAGARISPRDHRSSAFFAAAVAYLVQSSVSIDLLPLRSGLWTVLAGLVISMGHAGIPAGESVPLPRTTVTRTPRRVVTATVVALALAAPSLWYAGGLVLADHRAATARKAFAAGDVARGRAAFGAAAAFRFEPEYLNLLGLELGTAALNRGEEGGPLIAEMQRVYGYLDEFPETYGILGQARNLHHWARFEPPANLEALSLLRRARRLDPENPEIDVRISEVLIDLGETERARELLEGWTPSLQGAFPPLWGVLSTARLLSGDPAGAHEALLEGVALDPSDCRVRIASALWEHHRRPHLPLDPSLSFTVQLNCGRGDYLYLSDLLSRVGAS